MDFLSQQVKKNIPHPVKATHQTEFHDNGIAFAIRGLGVSEVDISFMLSVFVSEGLCTQEVIDDLASGTPFAMPHMTPNPSSLTLKCHWTLLGDPTLHDSSDIYRKIGGGPVASGNWAWRPDKELWLGTFFMAYELDPKGLDSFAIDLSWDAMKVSPFHFEITGEDARLALGLAPPDLP